MKNLFKNCLSVEEVDGWLIPTRFTAAQLDYYAGSEPTLKRSRATSGITLAFRTAANKISFDYSIGHRARDWATFDVTVDGILFTSLEITDNEGRVELSLPGDESSEIRIYLPHLVEVKLRNLSSDASLIPVSDRAKRWLVLGDSITQGMVSRHPSNTYPTVISEQLCIETLNLGVGGIEFNSDELDYVGFDPDIITVALGCNDWGEADYNGTVARVTKYFDKLLSLYKNTERIYAIIPIWLGHEDEVRLGMNFRQHREAIAEAISRYPSVKTVDGYKLVPKMPEFFGDPGGRCVHPNDEGFLHYALALMKFIDF